MYFFISYYLHVLNNLQINNNKHFKNEQDASSRLRDYLYCDGHRSQKLTTSTSERTRLYSRRALSQSWDSTARCDTAVLTIWDTHTPTPTHTHSGTVSNHACPTGCSRSGHSDSQLQTVRGNPTLYSCAASVADVCRFQLPHGCSAWSSVSVACRLSKH